MAKTAITEVSANNTFQVWLDKTNELVQLISSDVLTASLASSNGDITIGNATLQGIFTANTVIVQDLLSVDIITPKSGSTAVQVNSPVNIVTNQTVLERLSSTSGPRLSLSNTTDTDWQIGFENNTTKNFVISNGSNVFRLSGTGNLELTGILSGTAQTANTVGLVATNTTNSTHYPLFANTATGNAQVRSDTGFTYNPNSGTLTSTTFEGNLIGNAATVTNGVYTTGNQTIGGTKTFTSTIAGSITGNANTVTNGVYTTGNQTIGGTKTFTSTISGSIDGNANTVTNGVYTTGTQTIGGTKTFTSDITIENTSPLIRFNDTDQVSGNYSIGAQLNELRFSNNSGSIIVIFDSSGNITADGDVTAFSDERLKTNVRTVDNALDKVTAMRGVFFEKDNRKGVGVIAQEIEKVLPEVVHDGEYKSVAYGNIVGVLIEAIKELRAEIEELKRGK